jgi:hypothetical protein
LLAKTNLAARRAEAVARHAGMLHEPKPPKGGNNANDCSMTIHYGRAHEPEANEKSWALS